jgi:hypothetical protein
VRKNTGQKKQKCKNCEGKGTSRRETRLSDAGGAGDWDQAVTRHDQDDLELAHRLAPGFERLDIPSRKTGRPIKGGLSTLPVAISRRARPAPEPLPRLR